jgi:syntaxin 6
MDHHPIKSASWMSAPLSDPHQALAQESALGYEEKIQLLVTTTGEIKCISKAIGQELQDQDIIIDDISHNLDTVKSRLDRYNAQARELAHSKEGPLLLISVILTIVLIFLVTWVIL